MDEKNGLSGYIATYCHTQQQQKGGFAIGLYKRRRLFLVGSIIPAFKTGYTVRSVKYGTIFKAEKKTFKYLCHLNSSSVLYYVRCVSQKTLKLECFSEAEVSYNLPEHPVSILRPPFSPQTFLVCTLYVHIRANASFGKKEVEEIRSCLLHENGENSKKLSQCLKNN